MSGNPMRQPRHIRGSEIGETARESALSNCRCTAALAIETLKPERFAGSSSRR